MKNLLLACCLLILPACENAKSAYHIKSVPEARQFVKLGIHHGLFPANQRAMHEARASAGKAAQGTWDQAKMERFVASWANKHPRLVEINLACTHGVITESQRLQQLSILDMADAAAANERAANRAAYSSAMNAAAASSNAAAARYNAQSSSALVPRGRTVYLQPVAGGGYRGTVY